MVVEGERRDGREHALIDVLVFFVQVQLSRPFPLSSTLASFAGSHDTLDLSTFRGLCSILSSGYPLAFPNAQRTPCTNSEKRF